VSQIEQPLAQVGPDEAGSARDQNALGRGERLGDHGAEI